MIQDNENTYAVIISIENYRFSEINRVKYANSDANLIYELFTEHFSIPKENITFWKDSSATKAALEEELPYLIRQLNKESNFIFFYAGHGFYKNNVNRLTVWDTHINNLEGTTVSIEDALLKPIYNSECNSFISFLDCCSEYLKENLHSRDLITNMNQSEFEAFAKTGKITAIFSSCSPGQKSYSSDTLKHGIWTWHIFNALSGKVKEAITKELYITDSSLQNYLKKEIPDFITKKNSN